MFFYKNEDGTKWHYNPIVSLRGLVSSQVKTIIRVVVYSCICGYCLNYFGTQELLDKHEECCSQYKAVNTTMPTEGKDDTMVFKNFQNCIECPIKFYFDRQSILIPINEMRGNTKLYQRHRMSAFYIYPVLRIGDDSVKIDPVGVLGSEDDDVSKILVEKLEGMAKSAYERFKEPVKMVFDDDARVSYDRAAVCYACKEGFVINSETRRKVRDHRHFTGRYRGALHSECNLKLKQRSFVIPVFAHNMSGYDSHMFVKLLAETEGGFECIPQNEEKYMSFSKHVLDDKNVYVKLKFKDTFRFLGKSLSYHVGTITDFRHTGECFTKEQQEVLRSKQHYPFEYMDTFSRFDETTPPPKKAFDSSLSSRGVVSEFPDN